MGGFLELEFLHIGIPPHWNLGCVSWIRDGLMKTLGDNWKNESWNLPEIVGKVLGRAKIKEGRQLVGMVRE
jgi:hypothetical protein